MSPKGVPHDQRLHEKALRLRAKGLYVREIAVALDVPRSTITSWLLPHTKESQRLWRLRNAGTCVDCGGPTDASGGRAKVAKRCHGCAVAHGRSQKYWTRERIIEAIERWVETHDQIPSAADWIRAAPDQSHPAISSVYAPRAGVFGSWNEAIEAAGFEPRAVGTYERTPEIRAKLSASQKRRHAKGRDADRHLAL